MKKELFILLVICFSSPSFGQNCSCADNFVWLKETFEKNDAGFRYVIDQKGDADYKKHTEVYAEKVKAITDKELCANVLLNWLQYFRRGHLWLQSIAPKGPSVIENVDNDKIRSQYKDWEKYAYNESEFNDYISHLTTPSLEGIWTSPPYTVGVRKVGNQYIGFILEGDGVYWSKAQVKFKIVDNDGKLSATYFLKNHTVNEIKSVELIGNNYLSMEFVAFKRVFPNYPDKASIERYLRFQSTNAPLFEKVDDKTAVLRIPSFDGFAKKQIDSVITANMLIITTTENLIIDLQNNGGGSDVSYEKLIPLIYTNPIRVVGVQFLSTPLNNSRMEAFAKDPEASYEEKKWANEALEKLNKNLGGFVNLESSIVGFDTSDTTYAFPKKVGVIINGGCGSTTEQFLLAAKQSKKVKLFGTTTFGSLDFSNMFSVTSPCNDLELGYCLTRSYRIPDFAIDGKGLQPDYYLDRDIPKYEWIDFVNKILSTP